MTFGNNSIKKRKTGATQADAAVPSPSSLCPACTGKQLSSCKTRRACRRACKCGGGGVEGWISLSGIRDVKVNCSEVCGDSDPSNWKGCTPSVPAKLGRVGHCCGTGVPCTEASDCSGGKGCCNNESCIP